MVVILDRIIQGRSLFSQITSELKETLVKYPDSFVILGGDFNECVDGTLDRTPPRGNEYDGLHFNSNILSLCAESSLTDTWRSFPLIYTNSLDLIEIGLPNQELTSFCSIAQLFSL